jgi:quercetin 2,3-dioxygenase
LPLLNIKKEGINKMTVATATRTASRVVPAEEMLEGGGFLVHRPFPTPLLRMIDPFLMLDQMGPVEYAPGKAVGAPDHPHRGFETVTYLLEGAAQHKDSHGNSGNLKAGDVQWMTAGSGLVHSETPSDEMMQNGGRMHGFQLWVNLPRKDKMIAPRYQDTASEKIPVVTSADGAVQVKVIAGSAMGAEAVIETRTPMLYLHYTLQPSASITQTVPENYNAFAYVVEGTGRFSQKEAKAFHLVLFERDGNEVSVTNTGDTPLSFLLLGGVPINEPVVSYGPFVMNTKAEIYQAIEDYQNGKMGSIDF